MALPVEEAASPRGRRGRFQQLSFGDRVWLKFALGIPVFFHVVLVWIPALITAVLSFMRWDNLQPVGDARPVGFRNFWQIFTIFDSKLFPALFNNLVLIVWLGMCSLVGMLFAYLLDKSSPPRFRRHALRITQSATRPPSTDSPPPVPVSTRRCVGHTLHATG